MVATYSSTGKQAINADLIHSVLANATFETQDFVSKGAVAKNQSRFADPKPADIRFQKVAASIVIEVGQLPPNEKALLVDLFDRYGEQKNGKLSVTQNYTKEDFDPETSQTTILSFIESKINKALGVSITRSNDNGLAQIPDASTIDVNEKSKSNVIAWLKQHIPQKPTMSQEQSFGR